MKILFISDTHGLHENIGKEILKPADIIIHAGDVSNIGRFYEVSKFLHWFSSLKQYKHKIAGNHDFYFQNESKLLIQSMLDEHPDIIYLENNSVEIDGVKFWGSPYSLPFFNWAFMKPECDLKNIWSLIPDDVDVLITHTPAYGILDYAIYGKEHTGSKSLYKRILKVKPKIHVSGHIHEGYGILEEDGITYLNASLLNEKYNMVNKPLILTI